MFIVVAFITTLPALAFGYPLTQENITQHLQNGSDVNINSTLQCPTWYIPTSSGCKCGSTLGPLIKCYGHEQVKVRAAYCMDFDENSQQVLVGNCPYVNEDEQRGVYIEQLKNHTMLNRNLCSWANRTGFLCSHCKDGFGVATMTYSYTCMKCIGKIKGWILYIFLALFPTTVFFLFVVFCRIRTNSEKMNTMVCIFQIMIFYMDKYPYTVRGSIYGKRGDSILLAAVTIAGVWSLDFFRHVIPPFCISKDLSILNVIAMEYVVAICPLLLMLTTYICIELHGRDFKPLQWLWLPFKWCLQCTPWNLDVRPSIIEAFASVLQLSYSKLIFVSFNLLAFVDKQNMKGELVPPRVLYYNSNVAYLSKSHVPYFVLSLTTLILLVIIPMVLLFIYPTRTFQRFLGLFPSVNWLPLHAFADAFNGSFKNGTKGTRDYRFVGGFYFLVRLLFYLPAVISSFKSAIFFTITPFLAVLLFSLLQPYKDNFYNKLNTLYWSLLLLLQILSIYNLYIFQIPTYIQLPILLIPYVHMFALISSEVLCTCSPTAHEKIKHACGRLLTFMWGMSQAQPHQNTQNPDDREIECSLQDEPDRLINPESYMLLANNNSMNISSYGANT